jgi:hypothetical protein
MSTGYKIGVMDDVVRVVTVVIVFIVNTPRYESLLTKIVCL